MSVLADRADEIDGKGSVIGIFQAVAAKRFPTALNGVLVMRFSLDDDEDAGSDGLILDVRLLGPADERLSSMKVASDVPPTSDLAPLRGVDVTLDLRSVLLPRPGVYRFEIWSKDRLAAVVPLAAWLSD
jgi:hypothetical protein